jgi:hypothetical protein
MAVPFWLAETAAAHVRELARSGRALLRLYEKLTRT